MTLRVPEEICMFHFENKFASKPLLCFDVSGYSANSVATLFETDKFPRRCVCVFVPGN